MIYGSLDNRRYESGDLRDLAETVQNTVSDLLPHINEFDSIAVQGTSGLVVGAPAAIQLNKTLVVVRKHGDNSHGSDGEVISARSTGRRVLFLDDFVSCGNTQARVEKGIESTREGRVTCRYEYTHRSFTDLQVELRPAYVAPPKIEYETELLGYVGSADAPIPF